jgi:hypothetical protein
MHAFAATGAGFLCAVLWFDLMFDMLAWRHANGAVPPERLAQIGAYYRRVTTEASPMGQLVAVVMLATLIALAAEVALHAAPARIAWLCLALTASATGLARVRIIPAAVKLGQATDDDATLSRLARQVLREHLYCLAAMASVAALQLAAGLMRV